MDSLNVLLLMLYLLSRKKSVSHCLSTTSLPIIDTLDSKQIDQLIPAQIIVKKEEVDTLAHLLEDEVMIKYHLPMINSYVLEVAKNSLSRLYNMDSLEHLESAHLLEVDSMLTAQMKNASKEIHLNYAHQRNIMGDGIGVAVLDTGVAPHPDLTIGRNRIVAFYDVINGRKYPYDDNGHGSHVCGIIAGSGYESAGLYRGVAPRCNIIGVKVLNHKGNGNVSDVLAGLQWVLDNRARYNIRIVNISVGTSSNDSIDESSLLVKGVNAVWDAGIVVVVAAGNNGPKPMTISTPGISRKIITVGASDDDIPVELAGGKTKDYSGRGPTRNAIKKPDIVAPGSNIVSCNGFRGNRKLKGIVGPLSLGPGTEENLFNNMYTIKSGTSMSTPMVTGAIALLLSKYPQMTPKEVKMKIKDSSTSLGMDHSHQGWGLLDIEKLLQ